MDAVVGVVIASFLSVLVAVRLRCKKDMKPRVHLDDAAKLVSRDCTFCDEDTVEVTNRFTVAPSYSNPSTTHHQMDKEHPAVALLARAHSPSTTSQIFRDKIQNRPLLLRPSSPDPREKARTKRQNARLAKAKAARKSKKPRALTAKQKRQLAVYDIPKDQQKYAIYLPIWKLWCGYMRDILAMDKCRHVNAAGVGPLLASAEYHGALVEVVRCRCVGRVGIRGIVVKDTKFTLELITPDNQLKSMCLSLMQSNILH
jgi:ribonuclease P protein subunit POP4